MRIQKFFEAVEPDDPQVHQYIAAEAQRHHTLVVCRIEMGQTSRGHRRGTLVVTDTAEPQPPEHP